MDYRANDNTVKEEIRAKLDIAAVVGRYVNLKQAGANMKGCCPFHKEKTPSFMVNAEKGIFHCFGCGKGGDVFSFLMEIEGLEFLDVLKMCAEETGVRLQQPLQVQERSVDSNPGVALTKTELLRIHQIAAAWFYSQMRKNQTAIDYFKQRGLTGQTVQEFQLGFAPDGWSNLLAHAAGQGIGREALIACGLAVPKDGGSAYDRFRGRIMFPLFDMSGKVIAFAGRGITKEAEPKYLNSPETALYHKSRTLYGLHKARPYIKEAGELMVVEGYMDFLTPYQAGVRNLVATSGTALTVEHGQIIQRFTNRVILMFDGDAAGVAAAERGVTVLAPFNLDVRVCLLPTEHDPDTFVKEKGADALRRMVSGAPNGTLFLLEYAIRRHGAESPQSKSMVVRRMLELLAAMNDPIVVASAVKRVAERLGVSEQVISHELRMHQGKPTSSPPTRSRPGFWPCCCTIRSWLRWRWSGFRRKH
jgi:DNA primase